MVYLSRCLIRGANWNNGGNAGVFNSNLNNPRSNANSNVGGRSAFRLFTLIIAAICTESGLFLTGNNCVCRLKGNHCAFCVLQKII